MGLALTDTGTSVLIAAGNAHICQYAYRPTMPASHSPRPYLHRVRTLGGVTVTDVQPVDHPWHYGISVAIPMLDGSSFWGGPTFTSEQGYVPLDNHGRVEHEEWLEQSVQLASATLRHRLAWFGHHGERILDEDRTLVARVGADAWTLELRVRLRNRTLRSLTIDSPATAGRPGGGYGGVFVRAAPEFRGGDVIDDDGREGDEAFGQRAKALTICSKDATITMTADEFAREQWFVRRDEYPGICAALAFDQPLAVPVGATLSRAYRIRIADVAA